MEGKLQYFNSITQQTDTGDCRNKLLKEILQDMTSSLHNWTYDLTDYLTTLNLSYGQVTGMKRNVIKQKVQDWDTDSWRQEMRDKSSLEIYRSQKTNIKSKEEVYDNTPASILLFKCRSNTLPLKDRQRFSAQADTSCPPVLVLVSYQIFINYIK